MASFDFDDMPNGGFYNDEHTHARELGLCFVVVTMDGEMSYFMACGVQIACDYDYDTFLP